MKNFVIISLFSLLGFGGYSQSKKFAKPKEAGYSTENLQGHLVDKDTYEFDKETRVKVGDSVLAGVPSGSDFFYLTEKKGMLSLDKINKLNYLVEDVVPSAGKPVRAAQYNNTTYKAKDIQRHVDGLKEKPNISYSDKAKLLMGKKLVITGFTEKDYGEGVKEVLATAKIGSKKYNIVFTKALLEHEIYLQ